MSLGQEPSRLFERDLDSACRGDVPIVALTLHQPLASFMVWGLKRVEGRDWTSKLRGRLWIHAASKPPAPEDIERGEAFYREVYGLDGDPSNSVQFPKHYPTSCLLGLVDVVDVASADDFETWESLPPGAKLEGAANGSGHFFLCEKQQRLVMPIQMSGQHKLWRLSKKVAQEVMPQLRDCEQMPISFLDYRAAKPAKGSKKNKKDKKTAATGGAEGLGELAAEGSGSVSALGYGGGSGGGGGGGDGGESESFLDLAAAQEDADLAEAMALSLALSASSSSSSGDEAAAIADAIAATDGAAAAAAGGGGGGGGSGGGGKSLAKQEEEEEEPAMTEAQRAKRVKALRKKLRQIEALRGRRSRGEALNDDQLTKIDEAAASESELQRLLVSR